MQRVRYLLLGMVLFLTTLSLHATLMTPLAVEDLTQRAELILHGMVTAKSCHKSDEGRIYTQVQLQISEVWKGKVSTNTFTIVHSGGTFGNIRTSVSGQVEYTVGEEVVAYLVINSRGEGVTLGLSQGKFSVWQDKTTGEKFTHNIFHGTRPDTAASAKHAAKAANDSATPALAEASARLSLADLATRTKGAVR